MSELFDHLPVAESECYSIFYSSIHQFSRQDQPSSAAQNPDGHPNATYHADGDESS